MKIDEIAPICSSSIRIKNREQLAELVELPCLKACETLYDKNIFTYWSSANPNTDLAEIGILYSSLSPENRKTAQELIASNRAELSEGSWGLAKDEIGLSISFPISTTDEVEDISNRMLELTAPFKEQDVLYGKRDITEASLLVEKILGCPLPPEEIYETLICLGYYIDDDERLIWESEELAQKHRDYIQKKETQTPTIK